MKHLAYLSTLFLIAFADPVAEGQLANQQSVRMDIHLTDRSRILGILGGSDLAVTTRTGLIHLASADRFHTKAGDQIVLEWDNGDRLEATFESSNILVDSLMGKLSIPLEAIDHVEIHREEKSPAIKPIEVSVSGQYAHHKTEYAYDGKIGQSWSSGAWGGWIEFDLGKSYRIESIVTHLSFDPPGAAIHDVYVSNKPIGKNRQDIERLKRFSGHRKDNDTLVVECKSDVSARYVQLHCPYSRAWFNVRELQVFGQQNGED